MTIERLPSGSYRVTQMYKGKRHRFTFDHKPNQREVTLKVAELIGDVSLQTGDTFGTCLEKYVAAKNNVLSPSTIVYYKQSGRVLPEWFMEKDINEITQVDVQKVVNDYAVGHSPKTVHNIHGVISAVIRLFKPDTIFHTTLPQTKPYEPKLPHKEDIERILEAAEGTEYHIPFQLGILGLRRGEIIALDLTDLHGDTLVIDKSMAYSEDGRYRVKNTPKTTSSIRTIPLKKELADEIREKGYIYKGYPQQIVKNLHRIQDRLGIPRCRFHDLRHYFVSYAHSRGWSDADIIAITGHKTDFVMKRVYRHSLSEENRKLELVNDILG